MIGGITTEPTTPPNVTKLSAKALLWVNQLGTKVEGNSTIDPCPNRRKQKKKPNINNMADGNAPMAKHIILNKLPIINVILR